MTVFDRLGVVKLGTMGLAGVALMALSAGCAAQTAGSHALWSVYFSAGADAAEAENWSEAETLYTSAIKQAETDTPGEPFLTIAKYSLATVYWEQNRRDDADKTLDTLKMTLDPAVVTPDLHGSVAVLNALGNSFYAEAEAKEKDATDKKLEGEALQGSRKDSNEKYHFARRYFQWAYVIDSHFLSPLSPELDNIVANLAMAYYQSGEYTQAIEGLLQLKQILAAATQRDTALSVGSVAYSLGSKGGAGRPNAAGGAAAALFSAEGIDSYLALSYEGSAGDLYQEKPSEAVMQLAKAEALVTPYLNDLSVSKSMHSGLARFYREHANILRKLKRNTEADKLDAMAKTLEPPAAK